MYLGIEGQPPSTGDPHANRARRSIGTPTGALSPHHQLPPHAGHHPQLPTTSGRRRRGGGRGREREEGGTGRRGLGIRAGVGVRGSAGAGVGVDTGVGVRPQPLTLNRTTSNMIRPKPWTAWGQQGRTDMGHFSPRGIQVQRTSESALHLDNLPLP